MTAPELKPCPFCGEDMPPHDDTSWVRCLGCGAETGLQPTGEEAIAAWNRRADLAAVPAQVTVKPLVWVGDGHWHSGDNEGWLEEANTPFGWGYAVEFGTLDTGPWKVSSTFGGDIVKFDTPSAAKAAAQADYESRILAALEPQPDPRDEVIARLVGALKDAADSLDDYSPFTGNTIETSASKRARAALAAAKEHAPTEYERKVSQMKKDFPNGI